MKMQGKNLEHIFHVFLFMVLVSQLNFLHQRISNVSETDEVQMLFAGSLWATCKHRTFSVPTYVEILLEEHICTVLVANIIGALPSSAVHFKNISAMH